MKNRVAIVGAGMTLFRRRMLESPKELSFEATRMALDSAGLELKDIQSVVSGSAPDAFDGMHMKGEYLLDGMGGIGKPISASTSEAELECSRLLADSGTLRRECTILVYALLRRKCHHCILILSTLSGAYSTRSSRDLLAQLCCGFSRWR